MGPLLDKDLAKRVTKALVEAKRTILNVDAATPQQWSEYYGAAKRNVAASAFTRRVESLDAAGAWDEIRGAIQRAIDAHLPKRRVGGRSSMFGGRPSNCPFRNHSFTHDGLEAARSRIADGQPVPESRFRLVSVATRWLRSAGFADEVLSLSASIEARINKRNDNFENDVSGHIASILDRRRPNSALDHVVLPDGTVTFDPDIVPSAAADGVRVWFANQEPVREDDFDDRWRAAFAPRADINPAWWGDLMRPITAEELELVFKTLAKDKAPGESGLTLRLFTGPAFSIFV
ncbi:hypothetical protein BC828DRAFT_399822 [Blastocladiella britannica]|nr:hypothetical protein BC828DRAFT_399822 [Blastocladiella britannica]